MTRVTVVGPGAIGAVVAARLAQNAAYDLTVCARTPLEALLIEAEDGPIRASPRVITDPSEGEPADWVLIATKTYDAAAAALWLERAMGPDTRVAVLQNGVEHVERFAPFVDRERLLPCVVDIPAERFGPGHVRQRSPGTLLVPAGPDGEAFVALFAHTTIRASTTDDFTTAAWRKLCINSAGAVSALTLRPAEVAWDESAADLMRRIVAECVAVGRTIGADLPDSLPDDVLAGYRGAAPQSLNSIHADRLAGRPMETDARNGVIVRLGARAGVPTPVNATVVALLQACEGHKP